MADEQQEKAMVALLMEQRHRLFSYVYTLVPHRADAEDIFQNACTVLWEKREEFEHGTDFFAWASRIAYFEAKAARTKFARSKVVFDDEVFEVVADAARDANDEDGAGDGSGSRRREALDYCLGKLALRDRQTLMTRYAEDGGVDAAAQESGRSTQATYKALSRLRRTLFNCVNGRISQAAS